MPKKIKKAPDRGFYLFTCFLLTLYKVAIIYFGLLGAEIALAAEDTVASHYFGKQLTPEAHKLYEAMEHMYTDGIFITGEDYDLVENGGAA